MVLGSTFLTDIRVQGLGARPWFDNKDEVHKLLLGYFVKRGKSRTLSAPLQFPKLAMNWKVAPEDAILTKAARRGYFGKWKAEAAKNGGLKALRFASLPDDDEG